MDWRTMGAAKKLIDKKVLRGLVPINALSPTHVEEISRKAVIDEVRAGTYVFKIGDQDNQTVYLLDGRVELLDEKRNIVGSVSAGTELACHPLAHKQPRQVGARAAGKVTVARVDSNLLDVLLTWDESAGYDVVEIDAEDDDDWMTRMLQSQAFLQLPPANIHQLLMRLEAIEVNAGDAIVRQGQEGDYFYIVKSGRLAVSRKASPTSKEVLLAELGEGACFGEEALVSGAKRNASVTMLTNGCLMRLAKEDFDELLCAPLVHEADFKTAQKLVDGGARWLDVRLPGEFDNQAIRGSDNLPLSALREQCSELDKGIDYVVCCDTGRRSAAGAFVLSQRGFNVYTLKNGLMEAPAEALVTKADARSGVTNRDADIIPFDAEHRPEQQAAAPDTVLIDRLAAVESEKQALEGEVRQLQAQIAQAQRREQSAEASQQEQHSSLQRLRQEVDTLAAQLSERDNQIERHRSTADAETRRLADELAAARDEVQAACQRVEAARSEKDAVQEELARLQQTLAQIKDSADGRDDALRKEMDQVVERQRAEQQRHDKQISELENDLARVREDYQQLGQRTSAVAGERDAAKRELQELQEELASARDKINGIETQNQGAFETLQQTLDERERALEAEQAESRKLRERVDELTNDCQRLEQQHGESAGEVERLNQRVAELQQEIEQTGGDLAKERDALAGQVEQLQQELDRGRQDREQLVQTQEGANQEKAELSGQLESARRELEERQQQIQTEALERKELERRLADAEAEITEKADQEEKLRAQLQSLSRTEEERSGELRDQLEQAQAGLLSVQSDLENARQRREEAEARNSELEARLLSLTKEHKSDLASTREAMSRAQTETENVKREQTRLMDSLRKTERTLERERHDHDAEVRRLRKELESAAGESSAGLASELEALQNKLKEDKRDRDDLEIKLGERSAQLEDVQAEVQRLRKQLEQAQDSARQAEQQLLESTQAANEEMAVRMEAEEKAQQALRTELAEVIAERNRSREQLTVQTQELDDLRRAIEAAREEEQERKKASRDALVQLERERDDALELQRQTREQLDQQRAEAEVARGLVDMQSASGGDDSVRAQLEQAKKNVDLAVHLRTQAEEKNAELEAGIAQLRAQLRDAQSQEDHRPPEAHISSLDGGDPQAATLFSPEYPEADAEPESVAPTGGDGAAQVAVDLPAADLTGAPGILPAAAQESSGGGFKRLLIGVVLVVALAAGGGWWWLQQRQSAADGEMAAGQPADVAAATGTTPQAGQDGKAADNTAPESRSAEAGSREKGAAPPVADQARETKAPEKQSDARAHEKTAAPHVPDFSRGASSLPQTATEPTPPVAVAPPVPARVEPEPPASMTTRQPRRSFSDRLSGGGKGPAMVELEADSFDMGSGASSPHFDERPRHRVELKRFAISKYEVTFAEYARFARATGRSLPADAGWGRDNRPVINIRWQDALAYTRWLSEQTGKHYRLPTEAEWEFAARSGSGTRYWWGNQPGKEHANCFDCASKWSGSKTAPVGSFPASPFGVQDMAGNVMEWVQDCYEPNYSAAPADGSAVTGGDCKRRVVRGGAFDSPAKNLRSTSREARAPDTRVNNLGFRVVRQ